MCEFGKLLHGAAFRATNQFILIDTTRIQARATEQNVGVTDDTFEHGFEIVITVRSLLPSLGSKNRVGHQENGDFRLFLLLQEGQRKPKGVKAALSPVGRVIDDEEVSRSMLPQKTIVFT